MTSALEILKLLKRYWIADMNKAIIVDLDGTLAEVEHRLINGVCDHTKIHLDRPNKAMKDIIGRMIVDHKIVICTARSELWREETENWLEDNKIHYDKLVMRHIKDRKPDYLCKYELYKTEIWRDYSVLCVFDDNTNVVNMWRDLNLTCFQIRNTEY